MKNLFTSIVNCGQTYFEKFTIRKLSASTSARWNESAQKLTRAHSYAQSPVWLTIVMYLTFAFPLIVASSFLEAITEVSVQTALYNSRILLPVAGVSLIIAVGIFIFKRIRLKKTVSSSAFQTVNEDYDRTIKLCKEELAVPPTADEADVLISAYKLSKKGKLRNFMPAKYTAVQHSIFTENGNLCFADAESVVAVPLSQITCICRVDKRTSFINWTKDEKPTSPKYRPYKIRVSQIGYTVKPYYSLRFTSSGEENEVVFPPYELEIFLKYVNAPLV